MSVIHPNGQKSHGTKQYDAAVIGGGPAGLSAAIRLAQNGGRVIVFEAKTYPHDKMCGEFLSPEGAGLLKILGLPDLLKEQGAVDIGQVLFTGSQGAVWQSDLPGRAYGLSRKKLDAALAAAARQGGVTVCEGTRVTGLSGGLANGFDIEASSAGQSQAVRARAVVGAYGKRDRLDTALGRSFMRRPQPFMALKAHFSGPDLHGRIEMNPFPGGYCGVSEIEDGLKNVCLLVRSSVFQAAGAGQPEPVEAFIAWMAAQNDHLGAWLAKAQRVHPHWIAIAQISFDPKPAVWQDVLMAGDTAGLIAPLAGDGISMAMEAGILAGDHLRRFLCGQWTAGQVRRSYASAWRKRFSYRLTLGRLLQPMLLRAGSAQRALNLLNAMPLLGRYLIQHTRGNGSVERYP